MTIEELKTGVAENNLDAIKELAIKMWNGDGIKKDKNATFKLWKKAYELNPSDNLVTKMMGNCYRIGLGVEADEDIAKEYFLEAANRGDSDSQYFLGAIFQERNSVECIEWYEKALSNGDIDSAVTLVPIYLEGKLINKNVDKVEQYLSVISESKNADAFLDIMRLYYFGTSDGNNKDINKAINWCKKAVECGSTTAVGNLSTLFVEAGMDKEEYYKYIVEIAVNFNNEALIQAYNYYSNLDGQENSAIAFEYLKKAIDNGYAPAYYKMGLVYFDGECNQAVDKDKAIEYWKIGCDKKDVNSMVMLGGCYLNGECVDQDISVAIQLLQEASELGSSVADQQLGVIYIQGEIVQQNVELGKELLEKSVNAGIAKAALDLAKYYLFGSYFGQDIDKSVQYFKKAADMGNAEAQNEIAVYFLQGSNGFTKDENKAFELFEKAATNNNAFAQLNISKCYYNGVGTEVDIEKSIFWCEKAVSNGNEDAIKMLNMLNSINKDIKNFDIQNGILMSYNGCADIIKIPESVTRIADNAFHSASNNYKNTGIAIIILPSSLKNIDENAFTNLLVPWLNFEISEHNEDFSVQDGVLFNKDKTLLIKYPIGKQELEYIVPHTVKQIAPNAFRYAMNLRKLVLSSSLENIGEEAITAVSNLQYIDFSKTKLVEIPRELCASCNNLVEVKFPPNLRKIGRGAFYGDNSLRRIVLPNELTEIAECAFGDCPNLFAINIPESVAKIGDSAFTQCTSLSALSISKNASVGSNAIPEHCKITYYPSNQSTPSVQKNKEKTGGCYVATCVYGSYDCPPVWTLRRFRDNTLSQNLFGRMFIRMYYAVSPTIVKMFGKYKWFHNMFKKPLDRLVSKLQRNGMEGTPYKD